MFCPECGIQVEKSYKFCPECGFKLFALTQNRTQDVATPTHQQSVTTEERNQKEKPVQVPKDVKEEQENTAQFKGQPASDDSEPARDGSTKQDLSDNTASSATPEIKTTPSTPYQNPSDGKSVTTRKLVTESCKEEERLSGTACALDSNAQLCRQTACLNNLSVPTSPPSPASSPACDEVTEQQTETPSDISTENSPNAVRIHDDKPSDNHPGPLSNSASSLTSTQETNTSAPALSEQTPQESDLVAKQSASEQDKEKRLSHEIQNLSESPEDHINPEERTLTEQTQRKEGQADEPNTKQIKSSVDPCSVTQETAKNIEGQLASDNLGSAMGHVSPQDTTATMETRTSPSSLHQKLSDRELDSQPEQQTEAPSDINPGNSPDVVTVPADKQSDIHSRKLSNSVSSQRSTKETISTAPEVPEQTPEKQTSPEIKTTSHETQNLSERPDESSNESRTNMEIQSITKQTDRKEDQAAGKKVADTKSDGKTNTHLTKRQEQQPGNSNVDVSRSLTPSSPPSQSDAEGGQLVAADILKKSH